MRSILNRKKAAFEMSMTTVVIIVLSMTMLALGLVLIRTIFKGAIYTAGNLNTETQSEIEKTFADPNNNIGVQLVGPDTRMLGICPGSQPYLHYYLATKTGGKINLTLTKENSSDTKLCKGLEKYIQLELSASSGKQYIQNDIDKTDTIILKLPTTSIPAGCEFHVTLTATWADNQSESDSMLVYFKKATLGVCQND